MLLCDFTHNLARRRKDKVAATRGSGPVCKLRIPVVGVGVDALFGLEFKSEA